MNKEDVVYILNGIPFSHKMDKILPLRNNMDGPRGYYTQKSKSDRERQILCKFTYMWNLKKKYKCTNIIKKKSLIQRTNGEVSQYLFHTVMGIL